MPLSAPHQGYDSVAGGPHTPLQRGPGTNQSRLHVVYRANQTYPRFLVTLEAFYDFAAYLSEVLCVILSDYNLICSACPGCPEDLQVHLPTGFAFSSCAMPKKNEPEERSDATDNATDACAALCPHRCQGR